MLGFPCNQFADQEPGTDDEILEFATSTFDVNFPMFSKIEVNGENEAELYTMLKAQAPDDDGNTDIAWNFTKFLVGADGNVIKRFSPQTEPIEIGEYIASLG